ncbi:OsmC-like protein [Paraliobacillus sp. PM-2]|uniref:OsmC family protein n=1 Tax=Paraliobacillus sp. PM-2 TaxID=1462524 RepID=UPI00061CC55E|nr:OsmC family protein [Paraliobacillus sp. PM-2]CQR46023.1 OsmC-like protein [Paraliobacillus sp. PM-2]
MITLKKVKDQPHEITNQKGVKSIAASSDNEVEGYSPVDYLASAVSFCMGLTLDALIKRDDLPIESYDIEVHVTKAEGRPSRLEKLDVDITFDTELEDKVKEKLIRSAKRGCTIGNTIEHGAEVNVTAK